MQQPPGLLGSAAGLGRLDALLQAARDGDHTRRPDRPQRAPHSLLPPHLLTATASVAAVAAAAASNPTEPAAAQHTASADAPVAPSSHNSTADAAKLASHPTAEPTATIAPQTSVAAAVLSH